MSQNCLFSYVLFLHVLRLDPYSARPLKSGFSRVFDEDLRKRDYINEE